MEVYSVKDACKLLNINPQTLRRWDKSGKIQCIRTQGGQRRIPKEEIARLLGCSLEELDRVKVEPPQKDFLGLKKKKREVRSLELEIKKEKASQALSQIRSDDVKKARDSLEILKIEQEKQKLLADKRQEEIEREKREKRQSWLNTWIEYAYKYLDPIPYIFPNLGIKPKSLPLELKVKTHKAVIMALEDVQTEENIDDVRLLINKVIDQIRNEYDRKHYYPQRKRELIQGAIGGLSFSWWINDKDRKIIISEIQKIIEEKIEGTEAPEDVNEIADKIKDQAVKTLEMLKQKEQGKQLEDSVKTFKKILQNLKE